MTDKHKRDVAEILREADRLIALQKAGKLPLLQTGDYRPFSLMASLFEPIGVIPAEYVH